MKHVDHKVFISYHHRLDQYYKDQLVKFDGDVFLDRSVDEGDIDDSLSDEGIRRKIRDKYLKGTSVTVLLAGSETRKRKHIDWELYSSMYDGENNKKSGVLVINLPVIQNPRIHIAHGESYLYSPYQLVHKWDGDLDVYSHLPERIIDNLKHEAKISITNWDMIANDIDLLRGLIDVTFKGREDCKYCLSGPRRERNS